MERLDDDNGAQILHCHVKISFPFVSNRSFFLSSFEEWVSSDKHVFANTTNEMDHVIAAN